MYDINQIETIEDMGVITDIVSDVDGSIISGIIHFNDNIDIGIDVQLYPHFKNYSEEVGINRADIKVTSINNTTRFLVAILGNSEICNGKLVNIKDPILLWHGKNLVTNNVQYTHGNMYSHIVKSDNTMLESGKEYIFSYNTDSEELSSVYNENLFDKYLTIGNQPNKRSYIKAKVKDTFDSYDLSRYQTQTLFKNDSANNSFMITNLQIEECTPDGLPTEYEPYSGGSVLLENIELCGIPNVAQDILFFDVDDGLWKIRREVKVLDIESPTCIEDVLIALDYPTIEVLNNKIQTQLSYFFMDNKSKISISTPKNSPECKFGVRKALPQEVEKMNLVIKQMHGGHVTIKNGKFYDELNREFIITGVNRADAFNDTYYFTSHSKVLINQITKFNFNVIRYCVNWNKFLNLKEDSGFTFNDYNFKILENFILLARQHGFRVIIDMHAPPSGWHSYEDLTGNLYDPSKIELQERYYAIIGEFAKRMGNNDNVLGYGLSNEPYVPLIDNDFDKSSKNYGNVCQKAIDEIRKYDNIHAVFIQPTNGYYKHVDGFISNDWRDYTQGTTHIPMPKLNDDKVIFENHWYMSSKKPYEFATSMIYIEFDKTNVESMKNAYYDLWQNNGYASNDIGTWKTISADLTPRNNADSIEAFLYIDSSSMDGNSTIFIKDIVFCSETNNQEVEKIHFDLSDDGLLSSFGYYTNDGTGFISYKTIVKENDISCFKITKSQDTLLFKDLYVNKGCKLSITANVFCQGNMSSSKNIRFKFEVNEFQKKDRTKPIFIPFNKESLEYYVHKYLLPCSNLYSGITFIGELGVETLTFNKYSNAELWHRDMKEIFDKYNLHYTWFNDYHPSLGFWLSNEGEDQYFSQQKYEMYMKYFADRIDMPLFFNYTFIESENNNITILDNSFQNSKSQIIILGNSKFDTDGIICVSNPIIKINNNEIILLEIKLHGIPNKYQDILYLDSKDSLWKICRKLKLTGICDNVRLENSFILLDNLIYETLSEKNQTLLNNIYLSMNDKISIHSSNNLSCKFGVKKYN